ncbi:TOBE domain-containing protein [Aliarcobacter cryaerophilus]|jgi:molybdopterin-binding protein|uniref:TOBE domain-containing protein n=4 Tax=Arcobacteraceae TaxID=2808963 RepID=A0AAU0P5H1_9BACT|nr:TOBE domain-containing protein [Aliarcobacter cryaerophilus]OQA74611.1 MAG: TOBE domain protein [Candidatus Dependentiae bacterium ADurb.Bin246]WNL16835.1 TOBE domain-containing protein [Arcobacter sp. AZ-2023]WPD03948.1 TOBE domain-containing protein [Arcobacter sp. DSM 115972]WPD05955.1 TOBE domain-containing protein [Arcobacter sp. DSM 115956]WPD08047.1 TOBE domain-containing protein [Arcobacter sp. DSM 115955]
MIARVKDIKTIDSLNIVEFDFNNITLKMMSLELHKEVKLESKVKLLVKPSNVIISKNYIEDISLSNQTLAKIVAIENGELLSSISLKIGDTTFESIITKESSKRLDLQEGNIVNILIKASDLSILRVLHD